MGEENAVFLQLMDRAQYALRNRSLSLVYEAFGAAKMARQLKAIDKNEFYTLYDILVVHGMNDPQYCRDNYGGVLE